MDPRIDFTDYHTRFGKWDLFERGELVYPWFLRPCRMRILMVVDAQISFSHAVFGLSAVLNTLRLNPEFFVKFDITRAHRQTDQFKPDPTTEPLAHSRYGPHYEGFRFAGPGMPAGFNLYDFDQVWFFGFYSSGGPGAMSDDELEALARWMDDGGGVLAMGDHAELGAALCARIPRVRSMRRWTNAQGVPPQGGATRHDTLSTGHNSQVTFDDESDDLPQRITPRYYPLWSFAFYNRERPHPVLCGTDGVIDILPDHPHEGDVIDEATINLGATFSFGSYSGIAEYPAAAGIQPTPEVIAWGDVPPIHTSTIDVNKGAANPKRFGVIGAYNGHEAGVGRVVVDSTWHHWFDVNLTGRPVTLLDSQPQDVTNAKTWGFFKTPAGITAYHRIQNYFRNVAIWLGPRNQQSCMFLRALWGTIQRYPAVERLSPRLAIWELGGVAIDALGRRASQCTVSNWIHDFFIERHIDDIFRRRPDPCLTCPPFELLERYVIGGMTRQLLTVAYELESEADRDDEEVTEKRVHEAVRVGLDEGWNEFVSDFRNSLESDRERLDALSSVTPRVRLMDARGNDAGQEAT